MSDIENINDNEKILCSECWTEEDERQYQRERQEELYLFLKSELEQAKQMAEKQRKQDRIISITLYASLIIVAIFVIFTIIFLVLGMR